MPREYFQARVSVQLSSQRIHELENGESAVADGERYIKKSDGLLCQGKFMRYRFIDEHKKAWPVNLMCGVLSVSRSGYYDWTGRGPSRHAQSNRELDRRIGEIFARAPATLWSAPDYRGVAR